MDYTSSTLFMDISEPFHASRDTTEDEESMLSGSHDLILAIWFDQSEAQFRRGGVENNRSKADHLLVALPPAVLRSIRDILQEQAGDRTLYHRLKDRLLRRFAPSKWQLVYNVIDHPDIGNLQPSQLLDSMLALLPAGEPPGLLFQGLYLRRLPGEISDHVVAADFRSVRDMAAIADKLWEASWSTSGSTQQQCPPPLPLLCSQGLHSWP